MKVAEKQETGAFQNWLRTEAAIAETTSYRNDFFIPRTPPLVAGAANRRT